MTYNKSPTMSDLCDFDKFSDKEIMEGDLDWNLTYYCERGEIFCRKIKECWLYNQAIKG
jgi:hypothetical protein